MAFFPIFSHDCQGFLFGAAPWQCPTFLFGAAPWQCLAFLFGADSCYNRLMATSFNVSPMSQTLELQPGETYEGSITVSLPADNTGEFAYQVSVVPYNVEGKDYMVDTSAITNFSQMANWIAIDQPTGVLQPSERREIKFAINVPLDASGNSQAAALIVSPDAGQNRADGVGVDNVFSIASVVYAKVAGETTHSGEILQNEIPAFTSFLPVYATVEVENTGNVYENANIVLDITNSLTGEPLLSSETRQIDNLPVVGLVHVEQKVTYNGDTSITSHELVILPIWFILLVILIVAGVAGGVFALVRQRKKRKAGL